MAEETKKEKNKEKKPGFFSRLGQRIKNLKSEFKKITWASPKATFRNFIIVVVGIVVIAGVIYGIDMGLTSLFELLRRVLGSGVAK